MKKIVISSEDRRLNVSSTTVGYLQENKTEQIEFSIPEQYKEYGRKACFEAGGQTFTKLLIGENSNILTFTRDMTQFKNLKMTIAFFKIEDEDEIVARTSTLNIVVEDAIICDDDIQPDDPKIIILDELITRVTELDSQVSKNENIREEQEAVREANEEIRKRNEEERVSSEFNREEAEKTRENAELSRNESENLREDNEKIRQANEEIRQANETARKDAEKSRENAEKERVESENERKTNETSRVSGENERVIAENEREANEESRERYITDLKEKVDNGDFNGKDGANGKDGENGADFNYNWKGTELGIKNSKETEYQYVDLKGDSGVYIGEEEPTDISKNVWIDSDGTPDKIDYEKYIDNKPKINNIELTGNKTGEELGLISEDALAGYYPRSEAEEEHKRLDQKINETRDELNRLKSNVLGTGTKSGTGIITLADSVIAELQSLSIEGILNQNTTTGKNLFNENTITKGKLVLDDGTISDNNQWYMSDYIEVESNETYTFSNKSGYPFQSFIVSEFDETKKLIKRNVQGMLYSNTPYTNTMTSTTKYVILNYHSYYATDNLQFEKGSASTDYEQYSGGVASPSSNYEQKIETLTGEFKTIVNNRNFLENRATSQTINGITFTVNNDKSVTLNGTSTASNTRFYIFGSKEKKESLNLPKSSSFQISGCEITDAQIYDEYINKFGTINTISQKGSGASSRTYEPEDKDAFYIGISSISKTFDNVTISPMLSIGAATYEEYQGTVVDNVLPDTEFMAQINDSIDAIEYRYIKSAGQYHQVLDKKIGKVVLAPEGWELDETNELTQTFKKTLSEAKVGTLKSNYFQYNLDGDQEKIVVKTNTTTGNNELYVSINKNTASTVDEFNEYLSQHTVEVYYQLAEPYSKDLGAVDMPITYATKTNIRTNSTLMPKVTVKYYRNVDATIQNLQASSEIATQEIANISKRLAIVEKGLN